MAHDRVARTIGQRAERDVARFGGNRCRHEARRHRAVRRKQLDAPVRKQRRQPSIGCHRKPAHRVRKRDRPLRRRRVVDAVERPDAVADRGVQPSIGADREVVRGFRTARHRAPDDARAWIEFAQERIRGARDPSRARALQLGEVGDAVAVAILAGIDATVARTVERHVEVDLDRIRDAVAVAVGLARVEAHVAVGVERGVVRDLERIGHAVAVAIGLARIGQAVAVRVSERSGRDLHGIRHAVRIAILTAVENAVAVRVERGIRSDLVGVHRSVVVAIARQARRLRDEGLDRLCGAAVEAQVDVRARALHDMAVAHDRAALHGARCARVDRIVVRVERAEVVAELVRDDIEVPVAGIGLDRVGERADQVAVHREAEAAAGRVEPRDAAVGQVAPAREEREEVARRFRERRPVVAERPERIGLVEEIRRIGLQPQVARHDRRIAVAAVDRGDGAIEGRDILGRRRGVVEDREELVVGVDRDLDHLADAGRNGAEARDAAIGATVVTVRAAAGRNLWRARPVRAHELGETRDQADAVARVARAAQRELALAVAEIDPARRARCAEREVAR